MEHLTTLDSGESREQWLEARKHYYTATQAAAITGSHPYTKLIDVWNEKTDPDWEQDADRNKYLDERAKVGQDREASILEWASADPRTGGAGNPFTANKALVATAERAAQGYASTPDGYKRARDNGLVLIECKTTQQDWATEGLPQHVYDQCQWQMFTTGAVSVWVAQERYAWSRGTATLVSTWLTVVLPDAARLAHLLMHVERFQANLAQGIAPESDIDLRLSAEIDFDDDDETIAGKIADAAALLAIDNDLSELAEIRARMAADTARDKVLVARLKVAAHGYEGRRVHLIGQRFIAKLIRGTRTKIDTDALDPATLRRITSWAESETVKFEPNPEYVATPAANSTESE